MNKEQLINKINLIPEFVLKDVAVEKIDDSIYQEWENKENWKAVTEIGNNEPLTFVTKKYQLIQFKDVFLPLIENIEKLEGNLVYYWGVGLIDIFPDEEKLKKGNDRIGIVSLNSVNKMSSVIIKFCMKHNERVITIPKDIAGFKRVHSGKAFEITQNFLTLVDKVRDIWDTVLTEFNKTDVDENFAITVLDEIDVKGGRIRKKVLNKVSSSANFNLWDLFMCLIDISEERNYKSDYHRRKKIDELSEKMFKYAVVSKLINA